MESNELNLNALLIDIIYGAPSTEDKHANKLTFTDYEIQFSAKRHC